MAEGSIQITDGGWVSSVLALVVPNSALRALEGSTGTQDPNMAPGSAFALRDGKIAEAQAWPGSHRAGPVR